MIKRINICFYGYLLFFYFLGKSLSAQNLQAIDSLFYRGVSLYRQEIYKEALQTMEFVDKVYPMHHRTTGSLLIQGKLHYKLRNYNKAVELFKKLINNYPDSRYADDAIYGMATAYYRQNDYKKAVFRLLEIIEIGNDDRLLRKVAKFSSDVMDYRLVVDDFLELLEMVQGERGKAAITLRLAQREIDSKQFDSAKKTIQNFLDMYPKSNYVLQMEQLLSRIENLDKGVLKIGVILPLTGLLEEPGKRLLSGIKYAVDLHNEKKSPKIELLIRDSEGKILKAIKAAQELCEDNEIIAIIGELESDLTAAVAGVAQSKKVVVLAPTATEDGLTSIGSYIFQQNSNLSLRAEALAEYAVSGLGLKRFAILYPADNYGESMRNAFIRTVESLEGEICIEKCYYEGAEDLNSQFASIRTTGIEKMIEDSLIIIVPEEEQKKDSDEEDIIDDVIEDTIKDAIIVKQTVPELVDSTELAVTSIDGIFMPVYNDELQFVIPQFAHFNIDARVFGGTSWNDVDLLKENQKYIDQKYIDGVMFLSDFYLDESNYLYYRFRDTYRMAMKRSPEKMDIFGYDTANMLLQVIRDEAPNREEIKKRLKEINYSGIRGRIVFNDQRVSPSFNLLQFKGGQIILIK
jgi:ABC-type branched-subunit amino acid transport system substrate-binding protein